MLENVLRLMVGRGERPASVDWWDRALKDAGFGEVAVRTKDLEGAVPVARTG